MNIFSEQPLMSVGSFRLFFGLKHFFPTIKTFYVGLALSASENNYHHFTCLVITAFDQALKKVLLRLKKSRNEPDEQGILWRKRQERERTRT